MKDEELCFHEATVLEFTKYPSSIKLKLKGVNIDGHMKKVDLLFNEIKTLEIDHKPAELPLMAAADGEVLTLNLKDKKADLLIEWNDFAHHLSFVKFYFIDCEEILINVKNEQNLTG